MTLLFTLIAAFSSPAHANLDTFLSQTEAHRSRVMKLAEHAATQSSLLNYAHQQKLFLKYMQLHDAPKTATALELRRDFGYFRVQTPAERLAEFYGRSKADLDLREQRILQQAIDDLNSLEALSKERFFRQHALNSTLIAKFQWLEKVIDWTDTKIARQIELHFTAEKFAAAQAFRGMQDAKAAELSRWLEERYTHIVGDCESVLFKL